MSTTDHPDHPLWATGKSDRYRSTLARFVSFDVHVGLAPACTGAGLARAFSDCLAELDVEEGMPTIALPAWSSFIERYLGHSEPFGVELRASAHRLAVLSIDEAAKARAMLSEIEDLVRHGLEEWDDRAPQADVSAGGGI